MMRGEGREQAAPVPVVGPRPADAVIPLSADQRQIWLHASMAPEAPLYNESITIHRFGSFDLDAMKRAVNEILRRHESWRTGFEMVDGELVQLVHPHRPIEIPVSDVSHLPEAERDAAALAIGSDDARRAIDLADAPLFRAHVVKLAEDDHRLYLTLHHIIFDGVSIYRVIVPELAALYEAFAAGRPSPLREPALQYGDYAVWQLDYLDSPPVKRQLDHWREALTGAPTKLELAGDRARSVERTHAGSMEVFHLSHELTESLKALSRAEGVTLYMTLLAAFKAMLHRYSGEEDIVVGGVTDLRRRPELEQLVGYFLNTMALRSRPSGEQPFRSYLGQVRDSVLGALGASEVPFDMVVRELKIRAEPGAHPLFNILFSIEPPVDPFPEGWDLTQMDVVVGAAKFDLYLELDERPDGMIGRFLYSTEIFEPATIRRMIGHWRTILEHIVVDPACRLADLPLLTADERQRMLIDWNDTAKPLPAESLPQAIAARAQAHPTAIALVSVDKSWSYADLDREAGRIAARLNAAGVRRGSLVGVLMNRSPETVAGLLAILRLGAAYLPLDPGFPAARLEHIVADAAPDTLLTQPKLAKMLSLQGCRIVLAAGPAGGEVPPIAEIAGDDLAYVLYTSGSTGKPKGVEVPHRALMNLLVAMSDKPGFTAGDSLLAVTTLSFDIAALEIFLPLLCGGRLILASRDDALDPARLAALLGSSRPSVMQATPATWRALLESGWAGDRKLKVLCGGEALSRDLADQLLARSGELWNMYGPTETTIWSTVHRIERGTGPIAIGRPIANTATYLLDAGGAPVPVGVIGELFIGGIGVAHGYRNRPDLTAERFGEMPVAPGVRLYRTGDLARYDSAGTLYCLGRTDNDEKIRGFRIAVEEVEGAFTSHPAIAAAAVRSWPDGSGGRMLTAYLVGHDDELPSVGALRDHLGKLLPDYMIPSRFEQLSVLPMTPNGKVDRKALPEPGGAVAMPDFVPPEGEAEERLAAIWREVLDVETIGRHDSFFDLGGHSLLVTKLLRRVEEDYGRKFSMAAFFQSYRLAAMAGRLAQGEPLNHSGAVAIQPLGSRPPLLWLEGGPTFLPLSRAVGLDQPFLGVPIDAMLEAAGERADFIECARQMVKIIRQIQPNGPYYVGGWCTAGILAFEVASQLRGTGEEVPLLLLAHSTNPTEFGRIGSFKLAWSKLRYHVDQWRRQPAGKSGRYLRDRLDGIAEVLGLRRAAMGEVPRLLRTALDRAAYDYRPSAYGGDVALFQPAERPDLLDSRPGWAPLVSGRFVAHEIPGTHSTMLLHPHVEQFGAAMRDELLRVQASRGARNLLRAVG
jgi:amino acid adenylation domain-containing protein